MGITNASAVSNAMARIYKLRPAKAQFTQSQRSLRLFKTTATITMEGSGKYFKAYTQPMTAVRPTKTGQEAEFPEARTIDYTEYTVAWSDLCELQASYNYTGYAAAQTKSKKAAVYDAATKLVTTADKDFGRQANAQLHQNSYCHLGQLAEAVRNAGDTGSWGSGAGYVKIQAGSISQFLPGMCLTIYDSNGTDVDITINDVFKTNEGPDGTRDRAPGIRFTEKSGESTGFASLVATDPIALDPYDNSNPPNFWSFDSWFDRSTSVVGLTRTATGNGWSIPHIKYWDGDGDGTGTLVALDLDEHLGEVAEELAWSVDYGRDERATDGIRVTAGAMAFLTTPRLVSELTRQVGDGMRYTKVLDAKDRAKLFGVTGFDGGYWHNPLLGPVMFQADNVATPNTFRMLEPDSWKWVIGHKGSLKEVEWLNRDGQTFHYQFGSNGRLKNAMVGGALMRLQLICDQPQANLLGGGLKSSIA